MVRDAVVLPTQSLLDVCAHLMDRGALAQQPAAALTPSPHDEKSLGANGKEDCKANSWPGGAVNR